MGRERGRDRGKGRGRWRRCGRREKGESVPWKSHYEGLAPSHKVQSESCQQKCFWFQQSGGCFCLCYKGGRALAAAVCSCSIFDLASSLVPPCPPSSPLPSPCLGQGQGQGCPMVPPPCKPKTTFGRTSIDSGNIHSVMIQ